MLFTISFIILLYFIYYLLYTKYYMIEKLYNKCKLEFSISIFELKIDKYKLYS